MIGQIIAVRFDGTFPQGNNPTPQHRVLSYNPATNKNEAITIDLLGQEIYKRQTFGTVFTEGHVGEYAPIWRRQVSTNNSYLFQIWYLGFTSEYFDEFGQRPLIGRLDVAFAAKPNAAELDLTRLTITHTDANGAHGDFVIQDNGSGLVTIYVKKTAWNQSTEFGYIGAFSTSNNSNLVDNGVYAPLPTAPISMDSTLSAGGETGSPDAVLFTAQTLTPSQQLQARINIGIINDAPSYNFLDFEAQMNASQLTPGKWYLIEDYQTISRIGGSTVAPLTYHHTEEPLLVQAVTPNKISNRAISTIYPLDEITYDVTKNASVPGGNDPVPRKGLIVERYDSINNIRIEGYDWRGVKNRRVLNTGKMSNTSNYTAGNIRLAGTGFQIQGLPVSNPDSALTRFRKFDISFASHVTFPDGPLTVTLAITTNYTTPRPLVKPDGTTNWTQAEITSTRGQLVYDPVRNVFVYHHLQSIAGNEVEGMYCLISNQKARGGTMAYTLPSNSVFEDYFTLNPVATNYNIHIGRTRGVYSDNITNNVFRSTCVNVNIGTQSYDNTFIGEVVNFRAGAELYHNLFATNIRWSDFRAEVFNNFIGSSVTPFGAIQNLKIGDTTYDSMILVDSYVTQINKCLIGAAFLLRGNYYSIDADAAGSGIYLYGSSGTTGRTYFHLRGSLSGSLISTISPLNKIIDRVLINSSIYDEETAGAGIPLSVQNALDGKYDVSNPAGYITADDVPNAVPITDNLLGTTATSALSENQGRILKGFIDTINGVLSSDDTTLDELQEIVEFIKLNRAELDALGISNIAGLQAALDAKVSTAALQGLITNNTSVLANTAKRTYPLADQNKLGTIQEGAQVNTVSPGDLPTRTTLNIDNVDNTSDINKPVSTAQAAAIALKYDASNPAGYITINDVPEGVVVVNNLTSTATNQALSAEQGRVLKGLVDTINTTLTSNDPALDSLQEVVTYIKANRTTLESLGISSISGLQGALDGKYSTTNPAGYITLAEVPPGPTGVDNLTSTSTTSFLTANQGRVLKGFVDTINGLLGSNDSTLDELQEIVDFIKLNRADLDALGIPSIAGLQAALDAKVSTSAVQGLITNNTSVLANTAKRSYPSADETKLAGIAAGATANQTDTFLRSRTNHTGSQLANTISDLQTAIAANSAVTANTAKRSYPTTEEAKVTANTLKRTYPQEDQNKLVTIQAGAQVNPTTGEIITGIEGTTGENRLDVLALKNLEVPNPDQFARIAGIFNIKTDAVPTEDSEAFVNSGALFTALANIPTESTEFGANPNFVAESITNMFPSYKAINAGGAIVIFCNTSDPRYARTEDGVHFTYHTPPVAAPIWDAAYGDGVLLVPVPGQGTSSIWRSTNKGVSFTQITTPNNNWQGITFARGRFTMVANNATTPAIAYSDDLGLTWSSGTLGNAENGLTNIMYGNGIWIATSLNWSIIQRSTNGQNFVDQTGANNFYNRGVFFKGKFVLTLIGQTAPRIRVSSDLGVTWTTQHVGDSAMQPRALEKVGGFLYLVSATGEIYRTEDVVTWEQIPSPVTTRIDTIVTVGGEKGNYILGLANGANPAIKSGSIY